MPSYHSKCASSSESPCFLLIPAGLVCKDGSKVPGTVHRVFCSQGLGFECFFGFCGWFSLRQNIHVWLVLVLASNPPTQLPQG